MPPTRPALDFFLVYGSLYTYLAVMRIKALADAVGLAVRVERLAARQGLPFDGRVPHPVDRDLLAPLVGTVANGETFRGDDRLRGGDRLDGRNAGGAYAWRRYCWTQS